MSISIQDRPMDLGYLQETHSNGLTNPQNASLYGYLQADAMDSSLNDQLNTLLSMGIAEDCIYQDIGSAGADERSEYIQMLLQLRRDDVLFITSLDKLGNTYADIIAQWQMLTKGKHVHVVVLDIPLLDTRKQQGKADGDFIADLTLQFLAYAAMRERESLRRRQHEGIMAAKARGVRFGRPPKPIPPQFDTVLRQWRNREISSRKAAQKLGVAQETFLRWSRRTQA